jgi:uncharacterized protein (DUF58 family)
VAAESAVRPLATPRLRAALWLTALGLVSSLAAGRPEPAAVAAPFALLALAGLREQGAASLEASLRLERERAHEGETIAGELELRSGTASDRVEARLLVAPGLELEQEDARAFSLRAGEQQTLALALHARRWGAYSAGRLRVRLYDRLRLLAEEQELDLRGSLRVYPHPEALRALARPLETQAAVGDQVARAKGEGIELAELRPFSTGDDLRRVNWQASARLGELVVNDFHPERNTAVVLLLDAVADVETAGGAPLDECVRAAAALAERYLARRDRVGLLGLGGRLRWLRPESGPWQRHRIVETLLESRALASAEEAGAALAVPARALPPGALVLVLSPLLEDAVVGTLLDLRGRGFDLAVLEIPPLRYLELEGAQAELGARLVTLERGLLRSRLRARGIAVVEWSNERSLEGAIRAMEEFRRRAHVVHA